MIPSAAVFASAIEDAEGIAITAMPISPSDLFALRQAHAQEDPMKIAGTNTIPFPVDQVWDALLDPAVLVRTIPGCERMETKGDHAYDMTVTAGWRRSAAPTPAPAC